MNFTDGIFMGTLLVICTHETREGIDLLFRPVFGRICSREAKTKFRQCDWSAKKFAAKKLDQLFSSYSFTCRFARTDSPSGKRHSSDHSTSC